MVGFVLILGLILGSFLAALTWRMPRGVPISKGRSFCPRCRKKIEWYDNIPLLSFFLLGRKCRFCKEKISARYPLIEFSTSVVFGWVYLFSDKIMSNVSWLTHIPEIYAQSFLLGIAFLLWGVVIVDLEHMLIPDEFVFWGLLITFIAFLFSGQALYVYAFSGMCCGLFFLILHLITHGQGMGLGDAKLGLLMGFIAGPVIVGMTLLTSFVVGAVVGTSLLIAGQAKLQQKIAFGPFLVVGFLGSLAFANDILRFF